MRKLLLAGVAVLSLGAATLPSAYAASTLGAAAGATTGSTLGFIFGGPVGAIVGGFSGAIVGSTVPDASVTFAGTHPVEQVYLKDHVKVGYKVGSTVKLYPIDGDDTHARLFLCQQPGVDRGPRQRQDRCVAGLRRFRPGGGLRQGASHHLDYLLR
jgi:uncharacterized protein YcfJ